jgi:hypothetical protein
VPAPETEIEAGLGNVVSAIAATLRPSAMVAVPVSVATLLPRAVLLPGALRGPSPLLLPLNRLLLRTLGLLLLVSLLGTLRRLLPGLLRTLRRLLPGLLGTLRRLLPGLLGTLRRLLPGLLGTLCRLLPGLLSTLCRLLPGLLGTLCRLLPGLLRTLSLLRTLRLLLLRLFLGSLLWSCSGLRALLFLRLSLLLRRPRLRLWSLCLRALLLCGPRRRLLWPALLLFRRLGLFFFGISPLRVGRNNRPECQEQGAGKGSSNVLHRNDLR